MSVLAAEVSREVALGLHRQMLAIRRFEERVYTLYLEGEIPGTLHQCQGQEAVAAGVCANLAKTDWITSTHRPHGHALAKGVSMRSAMAELYGKVTGCCRGKGGSMHLGDPAVGMLPAIAIVGGGNTVVTGLGLSFKLRKTGQVAVCFFGEGASNEGAFHEGLNFAAVKQLPIVFVCENNLYGASTSFDQVSLVPNVADRASAYGVEASTADGMDALAVYDAARVAIDKARSGRGPILLECKTYRFIGHSRGDARGYRSKAEEAEWLAKDPIPRIERDIVRMGLGTEADIDELRRSVEDELEDAILFSRESPLPQVSDAMEDVYA